MVLSLHAEAVVVRGALGERAAGRGGSASSCHCVTFTISGRRWSGPERLVELAERRRAVGSEEERSDLVHEVGALIAIDVEAHGSVATDDANARRVVRGDLFEPRLGRDGVEPFGARRPQRVGGFLRRLRALH